MLRLGGRKKISKRSKRGKPSKQGKPSKRSKQGKRSKRSKRSKMSKRGGAKEITEEDRFTESFYDKKAPTSIKVSESSNNLDGKYKLIDSNKEGNFEVYVYEKDKIYLSVARGGFQSKKGDVWIVKWFWILSDKNPLESKKMFEEFVSTGKWNSPGNVLNAGALRGIHVQRFELRDVEIKNKDSKDIKLKFN